MLLQFDGALCGFLISAVFFNSKFPLDFLLWFIFVCLTTLFSFVLSVFVFTSWNIVRSFSSLSDLSTDHFMTFPIPSQRKPTLVGCFSICAVDSPSFLDSSVPLLGYGLMCGGRRKLTRFLLPDCPSELERLFFS